MSVASRASPLQMRLGMGRSDGECYDFRNSCKPHTSAFTEVRSRIELLQHAIVEFFLAPVGGRLHEGQHYGMRILLAGRQLRLEQRRHEEPMRGRFDGADFALWPPRNHRES